MSIKYRIIRGVIAWIMRNYKYVLREMVIPDGKHLNPELLLRPRKAKSPATGE
jgi:hypothetical protein